MMNIPDALNAAINEANQDAERARVDLLAMENEEWFQRGLLRREKHVWVGQYIGEHLDENGDVCIWIWWHGTHLGALIWTPVMYRAKPGKSPAGPIPRGFLEWPLNIHLRWRHITCAIMD